MIELCTFTSLGGYIHQSSSALVTEKAVWSEIVSLQF